MNELVMADKASEWLRLKALVLDSISSPITRRVYNLGLDEFIGWYMQEPRLGFTKATVSAWRVALEARKLGPISINVRLTAVRKLAVEAADNGLLAPALAAGIARIKGVRAQGVRTGNWLTLRQAQALLSAPDIETAKGLRDRAILAVLLGCGLRRSEVAALTFEHVQQRDGRWCIIDLVGKHHRVRTIPMPTWVKVAIDAWATKAGVSERRVFRPVNRGDRVSGDAVSEKIIWQLLRPYAAAVGVAGIAPHDLRRTTAKLCPQELIDRLDKDHKIMRVSGPFTVEAVQPPEMSLGDATIVDTGFAGEPDELAGTFVIREVQMGESGQNLEAYLSKMVDLLRMDGVRFPDNKQKKFTRLEAIYATGSSAGIHAEGRWVNVGETDDDPEGDATVGVVFGPQYGPITAKMIEEVIKPAARRYDDLVFAGFSFDGAAQAVIDEGVPRLRLHIAHIRPDVNPGMNGLLKEQPGSQLFTVFGRPRTTVKGPDGDGMYTVEMEGVDVYDPVKNTVVDTGAAKVAAWFVDGDYDGRTFCLTQAFFPDHSAWDKLSKALAGVVDPERFELFSGTVSLPFPAGKHKSVAVKVIDPRGNEVMRVHGLGGDRR